MGEGAPCPRGGGSCSGWALVSATRLLPQFPSQVPLTPGLSPHWRAPAQAPLELIPRCERRAGGAGRGESSRHRAGVEVRDCGRPPTAPAHEARTTAAPPAGITPASGQGAPGPGSGTRRAQQEMTPAPVPGLAMARSTPLGKISPSRQRGGTEGVRGRRPGHWGWAGRRRERPESSPHWSWLLTGPAWQRGQRAVAAPGA